MPETRLIDANAAMDATTLFDWYISSVSEDDTPVWTREHIDELMRDFLVIPINAPTVDAVPEKRGKWICVNDDENVWMCDNCGAELAFEVGDPDSLEMFFCPHCGADMGGE